LTALHQHISGSRRLERAADVIAEIHDLVDTERGNIRERGLERPTISVHVRDGSKLHWASPFEMAEDSRNAGRCRDCRSL